MGRPWPINAAIYSRPSAVSLKVWLRETNETGAMRVTCLEINPGIQLSVAVELAQQTRVCDAIGAAGNRATATRQTTELTVLMLPEQT